MWGIPRRICNALRCSRCGEFATSVAGELRPKAAEVLNYRRPRTPFNGDPVSLDSCYDWIYKPHTQSRWIPDLSIRERHKGAVSRVSTIARPLLAHACLSLAYVLPPLQLLPNCFAAIKSPLRAALPRRTSPWYLHTSTRGSTSLAKSALCF